MQKSKRKEVKKVRPAENHAGNDAQTAFDLGRIVVRATLENEKRREACGGKGWKVGSLRSWDLVERPDTTGLREVEKESASGGTEGGDRRRRRSL